MSVSRHHRTGSLLIEVLLGMTLLLVAVMAVFALFPVGDKAVVNSDRATQAHQLARRLLEEQLARDYDDLLLGEFEDSRTVRHSQRNGSELETTFHIRIEVAQPDLDKDLKRLLVTVRWERGSGDVKKAPPVVLESLKGRVL